MPGTKQISCVSLFDSSYKSVFVASKYMKIYPIGKIPVFCRKNSGMPSFLFYKAVSAGFDRSDRSGNRHK
ncbi:MAG TPA: hypothetical protein DGC56_00695 [Alistipes putredinis]|uniref:Uncharacterized protein n=1 Tax=Alistipes putredinis DSM 17216 TaxID=445970 RepID=B0MWN0_9BACT|nr:hypothetical protein PARMER_01685 [Parabacteroides merdae ATCC 43184]EDS03358.1 hypothetical protein ALIPUT_01570 [Alistipes putredinis DSM 17216]MBT9919161.1 hypothetical protein [Alistipes putredinis]HBW11336.1 hypothetical protein [Alistipes sp.]HCF10025.1 hypothetical protein [Alistipes sp.]